MSSANSATATTDDDIEIRPIGEDEIAAWGAAVNLGFLRPQDPDGEEYRRLRYHPGRMQAAFDRGRVVGTMRSFPFKLALPGGALLPVSAVSGVTVQSTHRRRGLLSRMMANDLAAALERGEPAAVLIAAEYPIYGRFGFGPAARSHGVRIDLRVAGGLRADLPADLRSPAGGRLELIDLTELAKIGPGLHERWLPGRPGAVTRDDAYWQTLTGQVIQPGAEFKRPFAVVHRDAADTVTGLAVYRVDDQWDGMLPNCTLTVRDFMALDRATAVTLWRYLASVDWVTRLEVPRLGVDDPLPLLLANPRAALPHEDTGDFLWLRLLDLPAVCAARQFAGPGRVVLEIDDPAGYLAGRWALSADTTGTGAATPTTDAPDLALTAGALGTLFLGGESAGRLAAAGLLEERRPGAAFALDRLLATPQRPFNGDMF
ncbi:GNAT family N-acetyltransferase [Kitasatospora sp. LaBMicrA B282]|uniref:GNAT family N-acetyltransferase n=1 Tax=Kitasatospora sp. LaBMicrA B282 TaxID=3420949 RepID=UPI003D0EFB86